MIWSINFRFWSMRIHSICIQDYLRPVFNQECSARQDCDRLLTQWVYIVRRGFSNTFISLPGVDYCSCPLSILVVRFRSRTSPHQDRFWTIHVYLLVYLSSLVYGVLNDLGAIFVCESTIRYFFTRLDSFRLLGFNFLCIIFIITP